MPTKKKQIPNKALVPDLREALDKYTRHREFPNHAYSVQKLGFTVNDLRNALKGMSLSAAQRIIEAIDLYFHKLDRGHGN